MNKNQLVGINPRTGKRAVCSMVYEVLTKSPGTSFSASTLSNVVDKQFGVKMDARRLYHVLLRLMKKSGSYPHVYRVGHASYQFNPNLRPKNGSNRLDGTKKVVIKRPFGADNKPMLGKSVRMAKLTTVKTPKTVSGSALTVDADAVVLRDGSGSYYIARKVK
jgi:hypothetical protein